MNLLAIIEINAGGPGSGCNPEVGKCGRPSGKVQQTFKTNKGYQYTFLKSVTRGRPPGAKNLQKTPSSMKGKFKRYLEIPGWKGPGDRLSSIYDAKWGRGDKWVGKGVTLFVHRNFANKTVVIHEVPHDKMNQTETHKEFKFKNFGRAAGFLNKRYGIRMRLPRPGQLAGG